MATFSAYSTGSTTGYAKFSGLSTVGYDRAIYINVEGSQQKSWSISANATPNSSYTANFSGLNPSTTYEARCVVYRKSDWSVVYSNTSNFRTDAPPLPKLNIPSISYTNVTHSSITLQLSSSNATSYYIVCKKDAVVISAKDNSTGLFNFIDLESSTTYTFDFLCKANGYEDSNVGSSSKTTLSKPVIISWEWHIPKTSGIGFNVGADEWLAFYTKINEVRVAVLGVGSEYSFTTSPDYIAPGKDYYAWIFLQACNAINQLKGQVATELLNVASGDDIYAWYYENLKTALNNAII